MIKPACAGRAEGLRVHEYAGDADALALRAELDGHGLLVEEMPVQHPQMDRLNPHCINTVRFCTYTDRDAVHILLAAPRSARGVHFVDNVAAGGIIMAADLATGIITSRWRGRDGALLPQPSAHRRAPQGLSDPQLGTRRWHLCAARPAALYAVPQCRYLGWGRGLPFRGARRHHRVQLAAWDCLRRCRRAGAITMN